jgi:hypothetical protein
MALGGTGLRSSVVDRDAAASAALAARRRLIHIQMNMASSGSGRSTCFVAGVRGDAPRGCQHRQHRPARAGDDSIHACSRQYTHLGGAAPIAARVAGIEPLEPVPARRYLRSVRIEPSRINEERDTAVESFTRPAGIPGESTDSPDRPDLGSSAGLRSRAVPRWSLPISQLDTFQLEIAGTLK